MDVTVPAIRALLDADVGGRPVTSVYLHTDGAQFPRPGDYEARLQGLLREARARGDELGGADRDAVHADADAVTRWVRDEFERGTTRGLALFASGGRIVDRVEVARAVRNVARVSERPYVVPLQALLSRSHHIAAAVVRRDHARVFRYQLGQLSEFEAITSDVHGQHDQGGWSQARYQRGIERELLHHHKEVNEILMALHDQDPVDALVVAGPHADAVEFTRVLHPYLTEVLHGDPRPIDIDRGVEELVQALEETEQTLVSGRRSELLSRLADAKGQAAKAAWGIRHVMQAVNRKSVEVLFVVEGAGEPGFKSASGALALHERDAAAYGTPVEEVPDLIDEVIEEAVLSGAHIELFREPSRLDDHPVAALLRY